MATEIQISYIGPNITQRNWLLRLTRLTRLLPLCFEKDSSNAGAYLSGGYEGGNLNSMPIHMINEIKSYARIADSESYNITSIKVHHVKLVKIG